MGFGKKYTNKDKTNHKTIADRIDEYKQTRFLLAIESGDVKAVTDYVKKHSAEFGTGDNRPIIKICKILANKDTVSTENHLAIFKILAALCLPCSRMINESPLHILAGSTTPASHE